MDNRYYLYILRQTTKLWSTVLLKIKINAEGWSMESMMASISLDMW